MKCESRNENYNLLFSLDNISTTELTIIEVLIERDIESNEEKLKFFLDNEIKNKNTEWLENKIILLKSMLKDIKGE